MYDLADFCRSISAARPCCDRNSLSARLLSWSSRNGLVRARLNRELRRASGGSGACSTGIRVDGPSDPDSGVLRVLSAIDAIGCVRAKEERIELRHDGRPDEPDERTGAGGHPCPRWCPNVDRRCHSAAPSTIAGPPPRTVLPHCACGARKSCKSFLNPEAPEAPTPTEPPAPATLPPYNRSPPLGRVSITAAAPLLHPATAELEAAQSLRKGTLTHYQFESSAMAAVAGGGSKAGTADAVWDEDDVEKILVEPYTYITQVNAPPRWLTLSPCAAADAGGRCPARTCGRC